MKKENMKKYYITALFGILVLLPSCKKEQTFSLPGEFTVSKEVLRDKIRGGWAGQVIGCSYGGPTEFKYRGSMIQDYQVMTWYDDYIKETFTADPGLFDDVYMDLTFVAVLERAGLDAPADSFALAFANDDYKLWHANQAARYNILNGIMPPASGYWKNNPHADDIDFQIEADFAGMMCPGMINTASEICDRTGHIMNYGDGWYGGVYMASMYALSFMTDDIDYIVKEALSPIPAQSKFHQVISDVIKWHGKYPDDWRQCWFELQKKHTSEKGCPEGVFNAFDIDANINAAYVVIGLLYGEKDFFRTMDIATRCGQDSDCNPATAAGILGVILGYDKIPAFWKSSVEKVEDLKFPYTDMTLNQVYALSLKHASSLVMKNGGKDNGESLTIKVQTPEVLRFEECFEGLFPYERRVINRDILNEPIEAEFDGSGIVFMGAVKRLSGEKNDYIAFLDIYLDGVKTEQVKMPFDYIKRKYDIWYKYFPERGKHSIKIIWTNPDNDFRINQKDVVIYSDTPAKPLLQ
jgi:hypothetical protein